jgi:hypothetical protein
MTMLTIAALLYQFIMKVAQLVWGAAEGYEGQTTPLSTPGYEFRNSPKGSSCLR